MFTLSSHVGMCYSGISLVAVAYQLPWVVSSPPCPAPVLTTATWHACTGSDGQHIDLGIHQQSGWSALVTCRSSPAIYSSGVSSDSGHYTPLAYQTSSIMQLPCSHDSSCSRKVETPSTGSPADLEPIQRHTGRPVCLPGIRSLPVVLFPHLYLKLKRWL